MKYKNIPSMLHNFGHSFMSLMNYVDGQYAIDLLRDALQSVPGHRLEIRFPMRAVDLPAGASPKLRKSVALHADFLPKHMAGHGLAAGTVPEIVLVVFGDNRGMHCRVRATDDRGKSYDVLVSESR
jgi:hypothetical protein